MNTATGLGDTGFLLGKFMPVHRGHMYLIECARSQVRRLTVLVCTLEKEPIPGDLRYRWVRDLYPEANVQHLTDEKPSYPEEHPDCIVSVPGIANHIGIPAADRFHRRRPLDFVQPAKGVAQIADLGDANAGEFTGNCRDRFDLQS